MRIFIAALFAFLFVLLFRGLLSAETIDRVVAYVDYEAITLREFNASYEEALRSNPGLTKEEALDAVINRFLLLRKARLLRLEARDEEELLKEYVELKVRAFIKISEQDLKAYYNKNRKEFGKLGFDESRDRIEARLRDEELNKMLRGHIEALRSKSDIRVFGL